MKLLKNPELYKSIVFSAVISAVFSIAALIWNTFFGVFTLVLCALLLTSELLCSYRRYKKISELSQAIDRVLHGEDNALSDKYAEGELEILSSEIGKMTISLREQHELLITDRERLSDSIADISHQIRTPLTSANLLISFLSEPGITEKRRLGLCEQLSSLNVRIDRLVTTLLKMSRLDAGAVKFRRDSIPFDTLVNQSCEPLGIPLELRGIALDLNCPGSFTGDLQWTSEAVANIVKNCMEHTPRGGSISVRTAENPIYSEIVITDTGSGISHDDLPHIFDRFYKGCESAENQTGGFGIGLSLAQMIVSLQGGIISAGNAPEGGACFSIRFYKTSV